MPSTIDAPAAPPVAAPKPSAPAAPKPGPSASPTPAPGASAAPAPAAPALTPKQRMAERLQKASFKADLSSPNPLANVGAPEASKGDGPTPSATGQAADAQRPGAPDPVPGTERDALDEGTPAPKGDETTAEDAPMSPADKAIAEQLAGKDGKKVSPWKLVKEFKAQLASSHAENLELQKRLAAAAKADEAVQRAAGIEKRNAELEEEIRYVNYAKSKEFADKYQRPYEESWARAVNEVTQLNVTLEDGTVRKATQHDLLALYNTPLDQLDDVAERYFGKSSARVIRHVEKIRDLADAQARALESARKEGGERAEQLTATQQSIVNEVRTHWEEANAAIASKSEYLKPREGDDEWNAKLDQSRKLMEEAWNANAFDTAHTPEQRRDIARKQAAAKNRAIAYGPLLTHARRLAKQLADAQAELAAFKASGTVEGKMPANGNSPAAASSQSAFDRARARMTQAAVPAPVNFY